MDSMDIDETSTSTSETMGDDLSMRAVVEYTKLNFPNLGRCD
jgi:hypothetical protein